MLASEYTLNEAQARIDAIHAEHGQAIGKQQAALGTLQDLKVKWAGSRDAVAPTERLAERDALDGQDVADVLVTITNLKERAAFYEKTTVKYEAFSVAPATEQVHRLALELERAVLEGEQARLAAHEQRLAAVLAELVRITGNPAVSVGGSERESRSRGNGDLIGQRHRDLIHERLGAVEMAKRNYESARGNTQRLQAAYVQRFGE